MTARPLLRLVAFARLAGLVAASGLLAPSPAALALDLSVETGTPSPKAVEVDLLTSDGQVLRFPDDLLGKGPMLLSFTLTGCVAQCPPSDAIMDAVAGLAKAEGRTDLTLATLTLNPIDDTPERLKAERASRLDPSRLFLTGHPADVFAVLEGLGLRASTGEDHAVRFFRWEPGDAGPTSRDGFVDPKDLYAWVRSRP